MTYVSAPKVVVCIDLLLRGSSKNRIPQMLGGDILRLLVTWADNSLRMRSESEHCMTSCSNLFHVAN